VIFKLTQIVISVGLIFCPKRRCVAEAEVGKKGGYGFFFNRHTGGVDDYAT